MNGACWQPRASGALPSRLLVAAQPFQQPGALGLFGYGWRGGRLAGRRGRLRHFDERRLLIICGGSNRFGLGNLRHVTSTNAKMSLQRLLHLAGARRQRRALC